MRVAIVHPWLPQYRLEFFRQLISNAAKYGIEITVFHGAVPKEWRRRKDSVSSNEFIELASRQVKLPKGSLIYKGVMPIFRSGKFDLIILEHGVRNIETYLLMLYSRGSAIAFWGHGKNYTLRQARLIERLKDWLASRGQWFFSYTAGGAEHLSQRGLRRERITIVQNSTDTNSLSDELRAITPEERDRFIGENQLGGFTALYMGGVDEAKRIPFLIESLRPLALRHSDFTLLIVGSGSLDTYVRSIASTEGWVKAPGPLFGRDRAAAMSASSAIVMPGRVGLVAVDSLVAGLPIITTDWEFHAPEFEYLHPGVDSVVTENTKSAFCDGVEKMMKDSGYLTALQVACRARAHIFSVERMAENFTAGLLAYRAAPRQPLL